MTKNEVIKEVKTAISTTFENMNIIEYEVLCYGTGTLTVLDDVLNSLPSQFRIIDPTVESITQQFDDYDIAELTDYCNDVAEKRGQQFTQALQNISSQLTEAITQVFTDTTEHNIGRLKYWIDMYANVTNGEEINHVNNYYQLLVEIMVNNDLTEDDMSDLKGDYSDWLHETANIILDSFGTPDEFDHDEWLQHLQRYEELTFQEQQYINMLQTQR